MPDNVMCLTTDKSCAKVFDFEFKAHEEIVKIGENKYSIKDAKVIKI